MGVLDEVYAPDRITERRQERFRCPFFLRLIHCLAARPNDDEVIFVLFILYLDMALNRRSIQNVVYTCKGQ